MAPHDNRGLRAVARGGVLGLGLLASLWVPCPCAQAQPAEVAQAASSSAAANSAPRLEAPVGDAGAPPLVVSESPVADERLVRKLEETRARVTLLMEGRLPIEVDAQSLFDVPLDSPVALGVERRRLAQWVTTELPGSADAGAGRGQAGLEDSVWRARLALDRARLAFYSLARSEQRRLLAVHTAAQQLARDAQDRAIAEARASADQAQRQQKAALQAAADATTEASRLVNEERARLLETARAQAEFEASILEQRAALEGGRENALSWRRRVSEVLARRDDDPGIADALYAELRLNLAKTRSQLAQALSDLSNPGKGAVPRPPATELGELPQGIDVTEVAALRTKVLIRAAELGKAEQALRAERARAILGQVESLNRQRLSLLPHLGAERRGQVLGFGGAGLDQASAEIRHAALVIRYHIHASFDWVAKLASGQLRGDYGFWFGFGALVKALLPLAVYLWWLRRGHTFLAEARRGFDGHNRRGRKSLAPRWTEKSMHFVERTRGPFEKLLLLKATVWALPTELAVSLEVRLVDTVLSWVVGSALVVAVLDAMTPSPTTASLSSGPSTAGLQLRSLRLVARAIVAAGLTLSLTALLVGRGTVYDWVFSTCWFAAIPLGLLLVRWWRQTVFARLAAQRKRNRFEQFLLSEQAGLRGSVAALCGGVFLLGRGIWRAVRSWVANVRLMQRLLAYLFRRDLSKRAEGQHGGAPLPLAVFNSMGPETTSKSVIASIREKELAAIQRVITARGGGVVVVVGERGSGKSTMVHRLSEGRSELVGVRCPRVGQGSFARQVAEAMGLPPSTELEAAVGELDRIEGSALVLDDAGRLVRPRVGGLEEFDHLLTLCRRHSSNCTWILAIDKAVWRFLRRARGAKPIFDEVLEVGGWSESHIAGLLAQRNRDLSLQPSFDNLLPEEAGEGDAMDRQEAAARTEYSYYRLIWDYAAGNPSVALHAWRRQLGLDPSGKAFVRVFQAAEPDQLEDLPDPSVFVLSAMVQLDWATPVEIEAVTGLLASEVEDALRYGGLRGYFEQDQGYYRVSWDWFRAVTRFLERRHLLVMPPLH